VRRARELHLDNAAFVWVSTGRLDRGAAAQAERAGLLSDVWPLPPPVVNEFARWAWEAVRDAREKWRNVDLGDEEDFFACEDELLALVRRAAAVLAKIERLGSRKVKLAIHTGRKLKRPELHLDLASIILCGTPVISGAHVPTRLLSEGRRAVVELLGLPALHACQEAALSFVENLERDRTAAVFASAARHQLGSGRYRGLSLAEVLCGDPQACTDLFKTRSRTLPEACVALSTRTNRLDPSRTAAAEALKQRLCQYPRESWDMATSETGEGSDASEAELPRRPERRKGGGGGDAKKRRQPFKRRLRPKRQARKATVAFNSKYGKAARGANAGAAPAPEGGHRVLGGADLLR